MLDRARFHWAVVTIYKGFYIAPNLSHQLHDSNRANPVANPGWNARGFMGGLWIGAIASDRNSVPPKSSARIADNEFAPHSKANAANPGLGCNKAEGVLEAHRFYQMESPPTPFRLHSCPVRYVCARYRRRYSERDKVVCFW
jgi:hypothetical protein